MKLDVRLFAQARDLVQSERVRIELPETPTVADLRRILAERHPELAPLSSTLLVAIGVDYAEDDRLLMPEDEVACFPPVSGG